MAATTRLLTIEDLSALPSDLHYELVDGVLIEMSPSNALHGWLSARFITPLGAYVSQHQLGFVVGEAGFVLRRQPDTLRECDVAFVRRERVPGGMPPETFWELAPDLVVEIVSPTDTRGEIQAKIREWIEAGVKLVLYVYPRTQTIEVIRSLQDRQTLSLQDTLDLDPVVPGFTCPVATLFGQ